MSLASTIPYALVVDDDAIILTDAAQILEEAGFCALTACDAEEAMGLLARYEDAISVLFTDVEMPGVMDGFGLARETAKRWPSTGILVASGRAALNDGDLPDGATFIRKPFDAQVVRDRLHEILPDGRKPEPLKRPT